METQKIYTVNSLLYSRTFNIFPVTIEVQVSPGIGIHVVGVPDEKVREMLLRVTTAIQARGYRMPSRKVVVNLSAQFLSPIYKPRLHQYWEMLDLPIMIGILVASGQVKDIPSDTTYYIGGLNLDGSLYMLESFAEKYLCPVLTYVHENGLSLIAPEPTIRRVHFLRDITPILDGSINEPTVISDTVPLLP